MYESHWSLTEKPFENDLNVRFFYESKNHKEAFVRILYATEQAKPLAIVMGDVGSGKTFVCRAAARELEKRGWHPALIDAPAQDPLELLREAALGFGVAEPPATRAALLGTLERVLEESVRAGRRPVLF